MGYAAASVKSAEPMMRNRQFQPFRDEARLTGHSGNVAVLPGVAEALQRIGHSASFRKDATVYEVGAPAESVYRVGSGTLRVVQLLPDGRRQISSFLNAGDFFGFAEMGEHAHSVEAITDCTLTRYPRRQFETSLQSRADAGHQIFRLMCQQIAATDRMLLLLGRKTAAERLASFLHVLAGPRELQRGTLVYLPMSRADIADHLGLTIETVSRTVTQFRQRKLIELADRNQIRVLDVEALEELAGE